LIPTKRGICIICIAELGASPDHHCSYFPRPRKRLNYLTSHQVFKRGAVNILI